MFEQLELSAKRGEGLSLLEEHLRSLLLGRVQALQLLVRDDGLVLRGYARTYYAKQLAQHAVMEKTTLPIRANEIEVS
jgi:hypothetical protein